MLKVYTQNVLQENLNIQERYMAVVTLGAVGMRMPLGGRKPALENVFQQVFDQVRFFPILISLSSNVHAVQPEESLKQAAACSLGKV